MDSRMDQTKDKFINVEKEEELLKPPVRGVMPRHIWECKRVKELTQAFERKMDAEEQIPTQWVEEYNELIIRRAEKGQKNERYGK